jgi:murein L,D-transpeptidase YcbB/YkuD
MMKMVSKFFQRLRRSARRQVSTQWKNQLCLFNKRPVLHRDFTQESLQDAIDELQYRLVALGYLSASSGQFDAETEQAVRIFQTNHNLFIDGVVGPLTWACLCYPQLSRRHKPAKADFTEAIEKLQTILRDEGHRIQDAQGCFGKETEQAVRQFQRKYGLKVDGVVGAVTWAVLLGMRQEVPQAFFRLPSQSLGSSGYLVISQAYVTSGKGFSPYGENKVYPEIQFQPQTQKNHLYCYLISSCKFAALC